MAAASRAYLPLLPSPQGVFITLTPNKTLPLHINFLLPVLFEILFS